MSVNRRNKGLHRFLAFMLIFQLCFGTLTMTEGRVFADSGAQAPETVGTEPAVDAIDINSDLTDDISVTESIYEDAAPVEELPGEGQADGAGNGLLGEYYNDIDFKDLAFVRIDPEINFDWGYKAPDPSMDNNSFSVRWTGQIEAEYTGKYTFYAYASNGVRLWVNGKRIIDEWRLLFPKEGKGTIELTAGEKYDIRVEYQEMIGKAKAVLSWSCKEQKKQVVPQERLYCLPKAPDGITAVPSITSVALKWNEAAGAESYEININGEIIGGVNTEEYVIDGLAPDTGYSIKIRSVSSFGAGEWSKEVAVKTLEDQEAAAGNGNGLKGEYYDNIIFKKLIFEKVDRQIDFDWGKGTPDPRIKKNSTFSVKWTGKLLPEYTARYTIYLHSNDGARLWINGKKLIDYWDSNGFREGSAAIDLVAGQKYDIKIEYFNILGDAEIRLSWSNPYVEKTVIPMEQLYTIPDIPENLQTAAEGSRITVTWDNTPGAEGYELEADGVIVNVGTEASYVHENLQPNTEHTYRVRAVNEVGKGEWSSLIKASTMLAVPQDITVKATSSAITLIWEPVEFAQYYDVEADGIIIDNGGSTIFTHSALSANTEHTYRVRARQDLGAGDWSEQLIIKTLLETPANIHAEARDNSITIKWDETAYASSYEVELAGVRTVTVAGTECVIDGLAPNTEYSYRVRAKCEGNESEWSGENSIITVLGAPENITFESIGTITEIRWDAVRDAERYEIEVDGTVLDNAANTFYIHSGLEPNSSHTYRVRAINGNGTGAWSSLLHKTAAPHIPAGLSAVSTSRTNTLSWAAVEEADSYEVEADGMIATNITDTTFVHKDIEPDSEHSYRVRAINSNGKGDWSLPLSKRTAPRVPSGINTLSASTEIRFTWEEVYEAQKYEIELDEALLTDITETAYKYSELTPNSKHSFRIRAVNDNGTGDWSELVYRYTAPDVPGNISTTSTSTSITLTWDAVEGAEGYDVEVLGSPVDIGNSTVYTDINLNPNIQRTYRVRAKNRNGIGDWSPIAAETTLTNAPVNLNIKSSETAIKLTWDAVPGATAYDVEADSILFEDILINEYNMSGLSPNSQHTFRVRSKNGGAIGQWSSMITGSTLPAVPVVTLTEASDNSIRTVWESVYGVLEYDIEADGIVIDCGTSSEYIHHGLLPNTSHTYRIRAKSEYGTGNWSELIEKLTLPGIPGNLTAEVGSNFVKLTWDKVDGAIGYEIEANGEVISAGIDNRFIHEGLTPNTEYSYRVRTISEAGAGSWSGEVRVLTLIGVPQNIKTFSVGSSIKLVWDEVYGITAHEIEADGTLIEIGPEAEYIHSELMPNTTHIYRIRAKKDDSAGDWSEPIFATTLLASIADVKAVSTNTTVALSWTPVGDAESYDIEVDGGIIMGILEPAYKAEGLLPNTPHTFRVMAKSETNISEWSALITKYTTPDIPSNVILSASTMNIAVSWDAVGGAVGYDIEVDGEVIDNGTKISYIHEGLSPNTQHVYRLRAKNEFESSEWSLMVTGTTEPELVFNCAEGSLFNFVIAAPKVEGALERTITVTYNPEELEAVDFCAATAGQEITAGDIPGTNLTVKEYTPGTIVFGLKDASKAIINAVKFKAKLNGQSKILYVIE